MNKILSKEGYLIKKNKCKNLDEIKKELTVKPYNPFNYGKKKKSIDSFEVWKENDKYISIPKFYGLDKLGKPDKNEELKGKKNKLKRTATLGRRRRESDRSAPAGSAA